MAKAATTTTPPGESTRAESLDAANAQLERAFGKGSIMRLGDRTQMTVDAVSTGSLGLDIALGIGGLHRIIEDPPEYFIRDHHSGASRRGR